MILELEQNYYVGYICIGSTKFSNEDYDEIITTQAYRELIEAVEKMSVPISEKEIRADVIAAPTRKRKQLNEIIDTFKNGEHRFSSPKGILVIYDISALGTRNDISYENYMKLIREDIGIWVLNPVYSHLSTINPITQSYNYDSQQEREKLADIVAEMEIKTKRGANTSKKIFTSSFKEIYWLYENYFIPETLVYDNIINGKTTRVTFRRYATAYEQSEEYIIDEAEQYQIAQKPKRLGKITEKFMILLDKVNHGEISLESACKQLHMTPITFQRYVLKGTDRSALTIAIHQYRNEEIIRQISPQ